MSCFSNRIVEGRGGGPYTVNVAKYEPGELATFKVCLSGRGGGGLCVCVCVRVLSCLFSCTHASNRATSAKGGNARGGVPRLGSLCVTRYNDETVPIAGLMHTVLPALVLSIFGGLSLLFVVLRFPAVAALFLIIGGVWGYAWAVVYVEVVIESVGGCFLGSLDVKRGGEGGCPAKMNV